MEIIFWIMLITWMVNRTVVDGLYALQGKPNPRYELAKAKLAAAGKAKDSGSTPRYATGDWWADLYSDALAANTHWRRQRAAEKAEARKQTPIDDLAELVREPRPPAHNEQKPSATPVDEDKQADERNRPVPSVVHTDQHPYCVTPCGPTCPASAARFGWRCGLCGVDRQGFASKAEAQSDSAKHPCQPHTEQSPDSRSEQADRPLAPVIPLFPIAKEIVMSNGADTNALDAAVAFAQAAAEAHESFATAGSEGYTGALERFEVGDECIGLAREAQEASATAAAKWAAHLESLQKHHTVKEAYQAVPDAGNKTFLLNG